MISMASHPNVGGKRILPQERVFTLVELLVVIGIIGILAGLLLSTLVRSKSTAISVSCKNLLKQYQLCSEMYANDWQDALPDARTHLDGKTGILPYFSKEKTVWPKDIARCPGDSKTEVLGRLGTFAAYENCLVSIGTSENALSDSARPTSVGLVAFWRKRAMFKKTSAAKIMTWGDWQNNPYSTTLTAAMIKPAAGAMGSLCFRHNGSSNAAFQDGHVGDMRLVGIKAASDGHDLEAGNNWGITGSIGQQYKMYYPFGPPPENVSASFTEKEFPTISYK